jgi:hypothetical protein
MEVMFDQVAGLDVGEELVTVCVRTPVHAVGAARRARSKRPVERLPHVAHRLGVFAGGSQSIGQRVRCGIGL